LAGLAEDGEGFEYLLNASAAGGFEAIGNLLWRLEGSGAERILDDTDLLGEGRWPRLLLSGGDGSFSGDQATQRLLHGGRIGCLELGTKPANDSIGFFGAALGVERDDVFKNLVGGKTG